MDRIYKSLADKNRRAILIMLKDKEMTVNQMLANLEIGQATLSSHLSVLKKSGLVKSRVEGKLRIYCRCGNVLYDLLKDIDKMMTKNVQTEISEIILRRITV
ncbi:MAG: metalloregulator ArsR/SmtB family transcription factor [Microgenomates group bacterium]